MSSSELPSWAAGLDPQKLPRHVAIIMDGNGRWARKRAQNRVKGHEQGVNTVRTIVRATREIGIPYLTLYAFSTENWKRPKAEVMALMVILRSFLISERPEMLENGIRLNTIGDTARLPAEVRDALSATLAATQDNQRMLLTLALSYGGREDLVQAARRLAEKARKNELDPEQIDEALVSRHLLTDGIPDPDLMIRTSGEMRISNFLLWQLAYAEFYFTPTLWPDFSRGEYVNILGGFGQRERRFGKTSDQLKDEAP